MDASSLHILQEIVQRNCHISDARYATEYTLCIYLLKMREYYRWEKGYSHDDALDSEKVGEWLTSREQLWDVLQEEDYRPLVINQRAHDPFDVESINEQLLPQGVVYSAGYGRRGAAHFFLAELEESKSENGTAILVSSRELARDLTSPPAMSLNDTIFLRRESFRRMLWEKVQESGWARCDTPMKRAMRCYGFDHDANLALDLMVNQQMTLLEWHEQGEQVVERRFGSSWSEMLLDNLGGGLEFQLRGVRDLLADCLVTLPALMDRKEPALLHFYISTLTPGQKQLFPALFSVYAEWLECQDWAAFESVVHEGADHWGAVASELVALHQSRSACWHDAANKIIEIASFGVHA